MSQLTRCPLRVSPFFSSTSMGWPCAALSRPRGNCDVVSAFCRLRRGRGCRCVFCAPSFVSFPRLWGVECVSAGSRYCWVGSLRAGRLPSKLVVDGGLHKNPIVASPRLRGNPSNMERKLSALRLPSQYHFALYLREQELQNAFYLM